MKKTLILSLLAASLLMTGCVQKDGYFVSSEHFKQDDTNNFIIANDFIDFAGTYYNPTTTKFVIDPENKDSEFTKVFESRLREKGYGVAYATMNEAAWLAWKISSIDDDTVMVTYHIQDSKYTKLYKLSHGKYAPVGAFTIFNPKPNISIPEIVYEEVKEEPIKEVKEEPKPIKKDPNEVWTTFVNSHSHLNIREKPTTRSKIVGTLSKSTEVEKDKSFENKYWMKIDSMYGYVFKKYMKYSHTKDEGDIIYDTKR